MNGSLDESTTFLTPLSKINDASSDESTLVVSKGGNGHEGQGDEAAGDCNEGSEGCVRDSASAEELDMQKGYFSHYSSCNQEIDMRQEALSETLAELLSLGELPPDVRYLVLEAIAQAHGMHGLSMEIGAMLRHQYSHLEHFDISLDALENEARKSAEETLLDWTRERAADQQASPQIGLDSIHGAQCDELALTRPSNTYDDRRFQTPVQLSSGNDAVRQAILPPVDVESVGSETPRRQLEPESVPRQRPVACSNPNGDESPCHRNQRPDPPSRQKPKQDPEEASHDGPNASGGCCNTRSEPEELSGAQQTGLVAAEEAAVLMDHRQEMRETEVVEAVQPETLEAEDAVEPPGVQEQRPNPPSDRKRMPDPVGEQRPDPPPLKSRRGNEARNKTKGDRERRSLREDQDEATTEESAERQEESLHFSADYLSIAGDTCMSNDSVISDGGGNEQSLSLRLSGISKIDDEESSRTEQPPSPSSCSSKQSQSNLSEEKVDGSDDGFQNNSQSNLSDESSSSEEENDEPYEEGKDFEIARRVNASVYGFRTECYVEHSLKDEDGNSTSFHCPKAHAPQFGGAKETFHDLVDFLLNSDSPSKPSASKCLGMKCPVEGCEAAFNVRVDLIESLSERIAEGRVKII